MLMKFFENFEKDEKSTFFDAAPDDFGSGKFKRTGKDRWGRTAAYGGGIGSECQRFG
jgi:hypothetical protein